jgi:hypothetical protein
MAKYRAQGCHRRGKKGKRSDSILKEFRNLV